MPTIRFACGPYGQRDSYTSQAPTLGFNAEWEDTLSGTYLLGNGYRAYSPSLMRFLAPDNWSPFDAGGLNAYGYCSGNPVMGLDPSGHADLSQLRKVPKRLLADARTERVRQTQQQTAQQRVDALRARLRQRQGDRAGAQRFRNPVAQQGTQYLPRPRSATTTPTVTQTLPTNPDRALAHSPEIQPLSLDQANALYEQLMTANGHEQTYINNLSYLAEGTEIRREYDSALTRIRAEMDRIRNLIGVETLQWFHF